MGCRLFSAVSALYNSYCLSTPKEMSQNRIVNNLIVDVQYCNLSRIYVYQGVVKAFFSIR